MAILGIVTKQPAEVQDYDVSFSEWLTALSDTSASYTVTADTGITVDSFSITGGVVKVWLSGGIDGVTYKVTVTLTTAGGRTRQSEFSLQVKEQQALEKFGKQPADVQDYDVDFTEYLTYFSDTPLSHTVVADAGITLSYATRAANKIKVWLAGGLNGVTYYVTVTMTTAAGRVRQTKFGIQVVET